MPKEVWTQTQPDSSGDQEYRVSTPYRLLTNGFFLLMAALSPFFIFAALRDGPGPTIFVSVWLAMMAYGAWWQSQRVAETLTLEKDVLHIYAGRSARRHVDIPLQDIRSIVWPRVGQYITIVHCDSRTWIPTQVKRLDELVVELRKRQPGIGFEGRWPPRRGW